MCPVASSVARWLDSHDPRWSDKGTRAACIACGSRDSYEAMNRAISVAGFRPVVDRTFGFDEAVEAMRYLESGAHFGKVCIRIAGS